MAGPDLHNSSSHYRDSHLCTKASDPNGKKNLVETLTRPPLLLLCTVAIPNGASWAPSGPHLEAVHEASRSGSSQRRRRTTKSHMSSHGSPAAYIVTTVALATPTSFGPTQHTFNYHHLPPSDVMERLDAQDSQHSCSHCMGF